MLYNIKLKNMKKLLLILFSIISISAYNQTALQFNGSNYVMTGIVPGSSGSSGLTIEANFRIDSPVTNFPGGVIISNKNNGLTIGVDSISGRLLFNSNSMMVSYLSPSSPTIGVWYHMAWVLNNTSISLYINGSLVEQNLLMNPPMSLQTVEWYLGSNPTLLGTSINTANCTIDNFRIWNSARTATEISNTYQECLTGTESNLILLYHFEEGSGTTVSDIAGGDQNGTLINSPLWVTGVSCAGCVANETVLTANSVLCSVNSGTTITTGSSEVGVNYYLRNDANDAIIAGPTPGTGSGLSFNTGNLTSTTTYNINAVQPSPGKGLDFDGANDYVQIGNVAPLNFNNTSSFTIEGWVKWNGGLAEIFSKMYDANPYTGYEVWIDGSGKLNYYLISSFGSSFISVSTNTNVYADNQPHHFAVSYDGSTIANGVKIYIDGVLQPFTINSDNLGANPINTTASVCLGSRSATAYYLNGKMDDIRVWNTVRTATEISNNYQNCLTGTEPNLVAYYDMEDGIGNVLTDKTSNNLNGTLLNMDNTDWITGLVQCGGLPICELEMTQKATVTVLPAKTSTITQTICAGDGIVVNGTTYNASVSGATQVINNVGAYNCDSTITINLTVLPAKTSTISQTLCAGDSIVVNGTTYNASNPTGTEVFTNVGPLGCDSTVNINLSYLTISMSLISTLPSSCTSADGTITCVPSGGIAPYTFQWSTGANTATVYGLMSSQYYWCEVFDANGCRFTQGVTLPQPYDYDVTINTVDVTCKGLNNGIAYLDSINGAVLPYSITWSNSSTQDTIYSLSPGNYTATITDANGCRPSGADAAGGITIQINEPLLPLDLTTASQTNLVCNGGANGSATVNTATGGNGGYSYDWTPGSPTGDGTTNVTGLTFGDWTCTVTDSKGCVDSVQFNLTQPAAMVLTIDTTNVTCNGANDGSATVSNILNGNAPYTYMWSSGGSGATRNNLSAGQYNVIVFDALGCSQFDYFNISQPDSIKGSQTLVECAGFTVTVGLNTYSSTGIFTDVLIAANGCDSTVTTDLTIENAIDVLINNTFMPTLTANQTGATYRWLDCDNGNAVIPSETSQSFTATTNGNYAVEITLGNCVDTSACENITGVGVSKLATTMASVYPNPTTGVVTIDLANNIKVVNYTITSVEGRLVEVGKTTANLIKVDLSNESKGIYLIKVSTESAFNVYRLVKQ